MKILTESKRFIATMVAVAVYIITMYTTSYPPVELASSIVMILSVYLGAETLKPTNKGKCIDIQQ